MGGGISLDALADLVGTPGSTTSAEKLTQNYLAGEIISALRVVYASATDTVMYGDNTALNTTRVIGVALNSAALGGSVSVQLFGKIEDPFFTYNVNEPLYLGASGAITNTAPTSGYRTPIGKGLGNGAIFVSIEGTIVL